ncbi:YraN family protein [Deinococcus sp.]|uniref:YraN family protein n=1 Tax=Deinococcus sp. TaxID=47478 RepID=UPI003C7C6192
MKGAGAEDRALAHLLRLGHELLERNYRIPGGELDLITCHGGVIVFTEVKQRRSGAYGTPLESVTPRKAALLQRAALQYLIRAHGREDLACRFDVIGILGSETGGHLTHLENVFG